jgi:hypothetical protein
MSICRLTQPEFGALERKKAERKQCVGFRDSMTATLNPYDTLRDGVSFPEMLRRAGYRVCVGGRQQAPGNRIMGSIRFTFVMKHHRTATRIIAGVLPAMALFATPAFAQDTAAAPAIQVQTTPPPVPTTEAPAAPAPTVAPSPAGPSAEDRARYQASLDAATKTTANPSDAAPAPSGRQAAGRPILATRPVPQRAAPAAALVAAAPVAAAPVAETPAPAGSPAPAPVTDTAAPAVAPAAAPATTETTSQQSESGGSSAPLLIAALVALAAIAGAVLFFRRRRADAYAEDWAEEPVYAEPEPAYVLADEPAAVEPAVVQPHDAPLMSEPVVEHADVVSAEQDEVAAITEAAAPVAGRPWIELSLRPVRAGATEEAALVDLELTLANAGEVDARDVRVSTFMLGDAADAPTDMERLLAKSHHGTDVEAGEIGAGEGSRIDARLAVPREEMAGATFQPVVGVDVRYKLPDGSEGRTAAAFTVGVHDDTEDPTPLRLGGDMREDVSASLHGVPERV